MKSLLLAAFVMVSASFANASVCEQSWSEIAASRLATDFPKIQFGSTFVSVDGVCVAGDRLYTTSKVEVCTEIATGEAGGCVSSVSEVLSTGVSYTRDIPVGERDFETVTEKHALTYQIPVGHYGETFSALCKKAYTIPACASGN